MKSFRLLLWIVTAALLLLLASCGETVGSTPDSTDAPAGTSGNITDPGQPGGTDTPGTAQPPVRDPSARPVDPKDITDGLPATMPVIRIDTDGAPILSKEEYIPGKVTLGDTEEAYALTDAPIEIRGRGNYSWYDTEKKSYRIKFQEKTNLLGQGNGPARSWTLLAVHCDQSLLRNATAFHLARHLSGIDFTSSVSFAKVYLNGEYQGVYQVSEQMQIQKYRVNVDDKATTPEVGFLLELDTQAWENSLFDGMNTYEIKNDVLTEEQYMFILDYMEKAWDAVWQGERPEIEKYLDLDSVVDTYLVEEIMKNLDAGWGSFYLYRDVGDKLHFGPVWDFDLSSGNAVPNDQDPDFVSPKYLYVGSQYFDYAQQHRWFNTLMEYDWFQELVKTRWNEVRETVDSAPAYVRAVAALYEEEFNENFERWPIFGQKINREPAAVLALHSHKEQAEYLASWLETRIAWLDRYMKGEVFAEPSGEDEETYTFSGGKGTRQEPYRIATAADFATFTQALLNGKRFDGQYFRQTADIDMAGVFGYNGAGDAGTFGGVYDGAGHILHVQIAGRDGCPFPYVTGIVMNVVTTGTVSNDYQAAGICRSVRSTGMIVNCASYVTVTSRRQLAGGIAASNQAGSTVQSCVFGGQISAPESFGPINCYMPGRDGTFKHNYYFTSCLPEEGEPVLLNETAMEGDAAPAAQALNTSLQDAPDRIGAAQLCSWVVKDGKLFLQAK